MKLTRVRAVLNKKGVLRVESVNAAPDGAANGVDEIASVQMGDDDA
jgi:hypothetical protein